MSELHRQGAPPLLSRNDTRGQRGQIEPETLQAHMPGGESERCSTQEGTEATFQVVAWEWVFESKKMRRGREHVKIREEERRAAVLIDPD